VQLERLPGPSVAQAADISWKHWEDYNPEWEEFKDEHSHEFDYWETEIYRGGVRSVNRFYAPK
jgi:hypothetical protein